jgi:hypothetical protein
LGHPIRQGIRSDKYLTGRCGHLTRHARSPGCHLDETIRIISSVRYSHGSDKIQVSPIQHQTGLRVGLDQGDDFSLGLMTDITDLPAAAATAQTTLPIDAQESEGGATFGAVDVLDEHPRRGEEISGGLLEEHVPRMTETSSLTTFLSLI